jgi:hypothetical protein
MGLRWVDLIDNDAFVILFFVSRLCFNALLLVAFALLLCAHTK